jgi:hypothetical protein
VKVEAHLGARAAQTQRRAPYPGTPAAAHLPGTGPAAVQMRQNHTAQPPHRPQSPVGAEVHGIGRQEVGLEMDQPGSQAPKTQAEIDDLLDSLGMIPCCLCGAITDGVDPVCYPCRSGNRRKPPYRTPPAISSVRLGSGRTGEKEPVECTNPSR